MIIDEAVLAKLVCPVTRTPLRYDKERRELISDAGRLAFPVRDGTPVLLVEQARPLEGNADG
nr:Trm112 family protein [uncultured Sphingosinicella sp.]